MVLSKIPFISTHAFDGTGELLEVCTGSWGGHGEVALHVSRVEVAATCVHQTSTQTRLSQ